MLTLIPRCFYEKWQVLTNPSKIDLASLGGAPDKGNINYGRSLPILRWVGYGNYERKMEKIAYEG